MNTARHADDRVMTRTRTNAIPTTGEGRHAAAPIMTSQPDSGPAAHKQPTHWDDYLAAVGELDSARRSAAASVASQERAAQSARTDLTSVRQRISLQRARLADIANRSHRPPPLVEPQAADRSSAGLLIPAAVMDPTPAVSAALTAAWAALDASDAMLTIVAEAPSGGGLLPSLRPAQRNAIPYAWYALLALIALIFINDSNDASVGARAVALVFDFAVPAGAFLLGVVSIGLLFAPGRDGKKPKNLLLGLLICGVPLVLGVALSIL